MNLDIMGNLSWIWDHVWSALRKIGGVGIVTALCSFIAFFISKRFEKRLDNKYEKKIENIKLDLDKQREDHKALLEQNTYIKKVRFDVAFQIYQDLFASFNTLVDDIFWLFPTGLDRITAIYHGDDEGLMNACMKRYDKAQLSYNDAIKMLGSRAPFIEKENYRKFKGILDLASKNLNSYLYASPYQIKHSPHDVGRKEIEQEAFKVTGDIETNWIILIDELRKYLSNLEIMEDKKNG